VQVDHGRSTLKQPDPHALASPVANAKDRRSRYVNVSRLIVMLAGALCFSQLAMATSLSLSGNWSYQYSGSTVLLTVDRITNNTTGGRSGTLRMELWAFASPFSGTSQSGYQLATYSLNPLNGGAYYSNVSSGSIAATRPPAGTWHIALLLSEFSSNSTWLTVNYLLTSAGQTMVCSSGVCTTSTPSAAATLSTSKSTYTVDAGDVLTLSGSIQAGASAGSTVDIYIQAQVNNAALYYLGPNLQWGTAATPLVPGFRLIDITAPNFYSLPLAGVPAGSYQFAIIVARAGADPTNTGNRVANAATTATFNAAPTLPGSGVRFNPPALEDAIVGTPYQFDFSPFASGGSGPYYFTLGTAGGFPPIGLILAPNGILSGTPTVQRDTQFDVCAVDLGGNQSCTTITLNARPRPAASSSLTGTWIGTWTRPVAGFCDFETSALTWTLTQSDGTVTGSFQRRVTAIDTFGLCPDPVGASSSGSLVNGVVSGNSLTIFTSGGTRFTATFDGTTITGTGGTSLGSGTFTLNRQ